jgi:hypothetical protein
MFLATLVILHPAGMVEAIPGGTPYISTALSRENIVGHVKIVTCKKTIKIIFYYEKCLLEKKIYTYDFRTSKQTI